jgi:phage baseplate assembly protein gpV
MASDTQRDIDSMQRAMRFFAEDVQKAEKASKGVAENLTQLGLQMQHHHRSFLEYIGNAIKLPNMFREASQVLVSTNGQLTDSLNRYRKDLAVAIDLQDTAQKRLNRLKSSKSISAANVEIAHAQSLVREAEANVNLEEKRIRLKEQMERITGKQLAAEFIMVKLLSDSIKRSGEMNQALIQANSLTSVRKQLSADIYSVQAKTGNSFQDMLAGAKALTNVWPKTRTDFKSTLETIVMMEEGLGVSYENSAQLARIFQINLKTSVRGVADQITVIANNTSLAADEATRFATEIGKAMRLLGPGAVSGAKEVTGYVTMLAGRMKDVGGDAGEIVKMFTEMNKGTSQAFMLRGISGVNSPGALGTRAGAEAAMQGLGRMIDRIVSAAPGTAAYTAQLEAAAQVLGTTTETIRLYKEMLEEAKKPLDEHAKLEQRWREQVGEANKALGRVKESFMALIRQALLPIIPPIASFFGMVAKFVSFLASNKVAVWTVTTALIAGAVRAAVSLGQLTAALYQVAVASAVAARAQMAAKFSAAAGSLPAPGAFASLIAKAPWLARITSPLATMSGWITKLGRMAVAPPVLAGLIGAAVGVSLGMLFNALFPKWAKQIGEGLYTAIYGKPIAKIERSGPGGKPIWEVMAQIRREALRGNMEEAMRIFEENKYKVAGLKGEKGAQGYIDQFTRTMAEVRERIGVSSVAVEEEKTKAYDETIIELTKKQLENSDEYLKRVREFEQRREAKEDARRAAEEKQRMLREAELKMLSRPYGRKLDRMM